MSRSLSGNPDVIAEQFHAAALGLADWSDALSALAAATGSHAAELLGIGRSDAPSFYCHNPVAEQGMDEFVAARGYDPAVNSRVRVGLRARELEILDERDFDTAGDAVRHPAYGHALRRLDIPFVTLTNLIKGADMSVGLSLLRRASEGVPDDSQRTLFAAIAPHVRAAVQTHLALEKQATAIVAGTMEAVSACAFLCDGHARVRALSPSAEELVARGGWLRIRDGVLVADTAADTRRLHAAFAQNGRASALSPPPPPFVLRDRAGAALPIEFARMPAASGFRFGHLTTLIARPPSPIEQRARVLARLLFGLTERESVIAGKLAAGLSPVAIADRSGVALGTVRVQLRSIYAKAGVGSQIELVARLAERL